MRGNREARARRRWLGWAAAGLVAAGMLSLAGLNAGLTGCQSTEEAAEPAGTPEGAEAVPAEEGGPAAAESALAAGEQEETSAEEGGPGEAGATGEEGAAEPAAVDARALLEALARESEAGPPADFARTAEAILEELEAGRGESPLEYSAALEETAALAGALAAPAPSPGAPGALRGDELALLAAVARGEAPPPPAPVAPPPAVPPPAVERSGPPAPPLPAAGPVEPAKPQDATQEPPAPPPDLAAKPVPPPAGEAEAQPEARQVEPPPRAGPFMTFYQVFHKTSAELMAFLRGYYPEWVEKGHVHQVKGKGRSVVIFGEKPVAEDPVTQRIVATIEEFDRLELDLRRAVVKPRYIDVNVAMDALVMAGVANIWQITTEQDTLTWKEGNQNRSVTRTKQSYIQTGLVQGATAPMPTPPYVPYVYEMPQSDPFALPPQSTREIQAEALLINFDKSSSTEERGVMVAVGTEEDIERIQAFVDSIDVPARRIMIEVQVIELDANKLLDVGIDSIQLGKGHTLGTLALPLPGEPIIQPGLGPDAREDPEQFVPDIVTDGLGVIFDDTSFDLQGRFLATIHALVREGDAKVKARPKILTLDDRTSVLHIGREVPTFKSTGVTRNSLDSNLISEISQVTTQYVGFTLNVRPRVTGDASDEVSLQIEVVVSELVERQRVFEQDLLGIPNLTKRHYIGQNRVKNHRPIILGGLIQEQEVESVNKIPLLADIPLLGYLFRRTQKSQSRREIILVLTPHILSEKGVDRAATPKESMHFDTFDSVLFNDRHIIKGSDVIGIDPINRVPAQGPDGRLYTEEDVVDLTLLKIIKERQLISKLNVLDEYLPEKSSDLSWFKRKWPERTVSWWDENERPLFFMAASIVIENIKELNSDLTFDELVLPRREILLPTTPYRISLSYDRAHALSELARQEKIFRSEGGVVDDELVKLLMGASGHNLRAFGDYLEKQKIGPEAHGEVLVELKQLYSGLRPEDNSLEGASYPEVYRKLDGANLTFVSIAQFFRTNLEGRYADTAPPRIGSFGADVDRFMKTSVSLTQRARHLQELEERWVQLNTESGEEIEE